MKKYKDFLSLNEHQAFDFLKIISDEERFKIVYLLHQKTYCVCELSELLNIPQNLISYHLKILKDFGLLILNPKGRKNFYELNQKQLNKNLKLINKIFN